LVLVLGDQLFTEHAFTRRIKTEDVVVVAEVMGEGKLCASPPQDRVYLHGDAKLCQNLRDGWTVTYAADDPDNTGTITRAMITV
jgi:deoxyribodipyrimidine photolyase-like uncharacterized protein